MSESRPVLKIVCVCRGGNVRSVAMKRILHRYLGHETLAVGIDNNGEECLRMLYGWADFIIVTHKAFAERIPAEFATKVQTFHIGLDVWGNSFHPELQGIVVDVLNANPLFHFGRKLCREKVTKDVYDYQAKVRTRNIDHHDPYL